MNAFLGNPETKKFLVKSAKQHRKADQYVQGLYWSGKKGCAVGCTLEDMRRHLGMSDIDHGGHGLYPELLGVPTELAYLQDRIFERLFMAKAQDWPVRFWSAVKPGTDLSGVGWLLASWVFGRDMLAGRFDDAPEGQAALVAASEMFLRQAGDDKPSTDEWNAVIDRLARDVARARARALALGRDLALALDLARALDLDLGRARALDLDLARAEYYEKVADKLIELIENAPLEKPKAS